MKIRGYRYRVYMSLRSIGLPADQAHKLMRAQFQLKFAR